ncbi:MAG: hypothetical protein M3277_11235 [Actinomycetota bacterium]|nr:hypothetical protein [Actinomycetota bacterium]
MKRIPAICVALLIVLAPVAAEARHRRPPAAKLVSGDTTQWGRLGTYCWSWFDEGESGGTGQCVDALPSWPRAKSARSEARTRIRFRVPGCPTEATLTWWEDIDENNFPVGDGQSLDARKKPMRRDGEVVACRLLFHLPDHRGHMYLDLFTTWDEIFRYEDGRGGGGDADYTFHLKLRP